ncbi:DUF1631 family protein [Denitratimonas sp. CY0512]|uniref:DUF1631 family protein n=1 Tax=Denitratimonas sp. CY0512 TaxID=3131940 RepID=UPI0030AC174A
MPETDIALRTRLRSELQEQLAQPLHQLFEELDNRLFDLAERSRVSAQQHLYFDGLRELRRMRVDIETAFLDAAAQALQSEPAPQTPAPRSRPLQLVDKDEQEETLSLETQVQRLGERLAPLLSTLLTRLAALDGQPPPADPLSSAMSPRGLGRAFRTAISRADVNVELRLIAHALFGQHVLRALETLYARLNTMLQEAGILPELPDPAITPRAPIPPLRRGQPRRMPDADADADAPRPAPPEPAQAADGNEVRLGEIQQLLQARKQAVQRLAADAPALSPDTESGPALPTATLDAALDTLWTYEGEPLQLKPQLLETARELADSGSLQPAAEDEDIIDLIGLLFSHIRHDPHLPEPLQGILARLHVPFLRTALKDPQLLRGSSHPARELVDELGQLAIGWCRSADPNSLLLKQIALTVEQLASHFQDERPIEFAQAVNDLRQQLESSRHRADLAEQRAIETVIGRERLTLARSRIATLLEQRLRQHEPMPWVRQLLRGPWSNHLALVWLRHGEASAAFRQVLEFVDELLWADDPSAAGNDPERLARARQTLPDLLRQGLTSVALHDSEIQALVARLEDFLQSQAEQREPPDYLYETDPSLAQSDFSAQWQHELVENQPHPDDIDPLLLAKLRSLQPGSWFEFRPTPEADAERAKLCWTSPYTGVSLFVNRNGNKVREAAPETLAAELEAGLASIIESNRLLERTLRTLIDELQQHGNGSTRAQRS